MHSQPAPSLAFCFRSITKSNGYSSAAILNFTLASSRRKPLISTKRRRPFGKKLAEVGRVAGIVGEAQPDRLVRPPEDLAGLPRYLKLLRVLALPLIHPALSGGLRFESRACLGYLHRARNQAIGGLLKASR